MEPGQEMSRILLVFDFDHTLIDGNSDLSVCKLAPGGAVPDYIQRLYSDRGWVPFMAAVFRHLHEHGISAETIQKCMESLPLTPGMQEMFEHIKAKSCYDTIILSDANSVLINYLLQYHNLDGVVSHVFTNPAEYSDNGCLLVRNFHTQDWCSLSTVNLCKGHILQDYIQRRSQEGMLYSHVLYVGDGTNDLCPGLTLSAKDYLLPRKGFSLWKKLQKKDLNEATSEKMVKASVVEWESAVEIRTLLESIAAGKMK